jgi:hypothetical protein
MKLPGFEVRAKAIPSFFAKRSPGSGMAPGCPFPAKSPDSAGLEAKSME